MLVYRYYDKCPMCNGVKDVRAKRCKECFMYKVKPRKGTAKDWHLHEKTGYLTRFIDGKWWYKHRYIMEQYLGRKLEQDEHVHHCDGNKLNNDLDNLELMLRSEHHKIHMTSDEAKIRGKLGHKVRWGFEE